MTHFLCVYTFKSIDFLFYIQLPFCALIMYVCPLSIFNKILYTSVTVLARVDLPLTSSVNARLDLVSLAAYLVELIHHMYVELSSVKQFRLSTILSLHGELLTHLTLAVILFILYSMFLAATIIHHHLLAYKI